MEERAFQRRIHRGISVLTGIVAVVVAIALMALADEPIAVLGGGRVLDLGAGPAVDHRGLGNALLGGPLGAGRRVAPSVARGSSRPEPFEPPAPVVQLRAEAPVASAQVKLRGAVEVRFAAVADEPSARKQARAAAIVSVSNARCSPSRACDARARGRTAGRSSRSHARRRRPRTHASSRLRCR